MKLDVLLNVRNLADPFLPDHLSSLRSFLRLRLASALSLFSVNGSTTACAMLFGAGSAPVADPSQAVGFSLFGMLMALVGLERWFVVLPLRFEAVWRWAFVRGNGRWPTSGRVP